MVDPRFLQQRLHMRQLRMIQALAEYGSLSAAARHLNLTQPAVTKALQDLEHLMQASLFERLPLGVRPTSTGRTVIAFAERTLVALDRLSEQLDRDGTLGQGHVVLGALPVTAAGLLPSMLVSLRNQHPLLELRLIVERTDGLVSKLLTGELDLVIGRLYAPEIPDGLQRRPFYIEPFAVLARTGHPIFALHKVAPADLTAWDVILPTFGQKLGREIEHLVAEMGLVPSLRLLRSSSNLLIRELLHSSNTITIAPTMLMAGDVIRGSLRVVPIKLPGPDRPAGLITSPLRPLTSAGELVFAAAQAAVRILAGDPHPITISYT